MFSSYSIQKAAEAQREQSERSSKLNVMLESTAYHAESVRYKQLQQQYYTQPTSVLKQQIKALEEDLLAKYDGYAARLKEFPNALTRVGSYSN